jgi:microcystin-dependent protein
MDAFLGTILAWPIEYAPQDWVFCDGCSLNIRQYAALFALIGGQYGGDGKTYFKVPDLRGRMILGAYGQSPLTRQLLGAKGGAESVSTVGTGAVNIVLTAANLPSHTHTASMKMDLSAKTEIKVGTATAGGKTDATTLATLTSTPTGVQNSAAIYLPSTTEQAAPITLGGVSTTVTGEGTVGIGNTGIGAPIPIPLSVTVTTATVPPYMALNYIICVAGVYPARV